MHNEMQEPSCLSKREKKESGMKLSGNSRKLFEFAFFLLLLRLLLKRLYFSPFLL